MELASSELICDLISNYFSAPEQLQNANNNINMNKGRHVDSVFNALDHRINGVDHTLQAMSMNMNGFEYTMNSLYSQHQKQRDYEMNLMQVELGQIIDDIWSNINGQIHKISDAIDYEQEKHDKLIKLEEDIKYLNENIPQEQEQENEKK